MVMKAELADPALRLVQPQVPAHLRQSRRGPSALKSLIRDARHRADQGREIVIFPEGTRRPPGAPPDYKPGFMLSTRAWACRATRWRSTPGLFWPRRSIVRYPGTIVIEVLDPIPPGLPRAEARPDPRAHRGGFAI